MKAPGHPGELLVSFLVAMFAWRQPVAIRIPLGCLLICFLLAPTPSMRVALLLYEPFSTSTFPHASTNLGRPVAGWTLGATPAEGSSVVRSSAGLSYAGLATQAGSRGVTRVPNASALERNAGRLLFSSVSSGSVYCSFLLKITDLPDVNRAMLTLSYFGSGNIDARDNGCNAMVWIAPDGRLLLGKYNAATPTAGPSWPLLTNVTYLVVLKFTFNAGAGNDLVALYLNPPLGQNEVEPATPVLSTTTGSDPPGDVIKSVWLPQGTIEGAIDYHFGSFSGEIDMDEIRVATTWAETTPWDGVTPPAQGTPRFTGVISEAGRLELSGVEGPIHSAYRMLRSTNVTSNSSNWPVLGVSNFDEQGGFKCQDSLSPTNEAAYYRVLLGSGGPAATVPPGITSQPQNLTVPIGADAVFSVSAVGSVPLSYPWYYTTNTPITNATKSTLTIPGAQFADAEKYSVRISNLQGQITSVHATLTVTNLTSAPQITLQPMDVVATEGQTAVLNAIAVGGAICQVAEIAGSHPRGAQVGPAARRGASRYPRRASHNYEQFGTRYEKGPFTDLSAGAGSIRERPKPLGQRQTQGFGQRPLPAIRQRPAVLLAGRHLLVARPETQSR